MFSTQDFLDLMKYFKSGETQTGVRFLDPKLIISAEDSKAKATTLFSDTIDLVCHDTDDYQRLKLFFISWYASLRTFNGIMQRASDVYSLPEDHLNHLINSFGFVDGLEKLSKTNKVDFFYSLVDLYKIKGTPECLGRVLSFFGITDIEILEYNLQYDNEYNLVFRPHKVITSTDFVTSTIDVEFNEMVGLDPHWLLTANQVNELFRNNKIAFPSKSPYYAIRPIINLSGKSGTIPSLAILYRIIQDTYLEYNSGKTIEKDFFLESLKIYVSNLDLYLGIIYLINLLHYREHDSTDLSFLIYNGDLKTDDGNYDFEAIRNLYESLTTRSYLNEITGERIPYDSTGVQQLKIEFDENFSRVRTTSFLTEFNTARDILAITYPDFKLLIESYWEEGKGENLLKHLLIDLSTWMKINISPLSVDLASLMLGFAALEFLEDVINFFKPYRARMAVGENVYIFNNSVEDGIIPEDEFGPLTTIDTFIDWDTANSKPCCCFDSTSWDVECIPCFDSTSCVSYSRETYDCGSYYDIGASVDEDMVDGGLLGVDPQISVIHTIYDIYNYHKDNQDLLAVEDGNTLPPDSTGDNRIILCEDGSKIIAQDRYETYVSNNYTGNITGEKYFHLQDGGWINFDSGGIFDSPVISDVCEIYISSV